MDKKKTKIRIGMQKFHFVIKSAFKFTEVVKLLD